MSIKPTKFASEKQKALFDVIAKSGNLIFACGKDGISANMTGKFVVRPFNNEDRLELESGENHVHLDWNKVTKVTETDFHGEGALTFYNGGDWLFKLYRPAGRYPAEIIKYLGDLL